MAIIEQIEGIGAAFGRKLAQEGIATSEALLEKGASAAARKALAESTGISETLLLRWANHADLFRISGVGPQYAELLEAAGVDSVPADGERQMIARILFAMIFVGALMGPPAKAEPMVACFQTETVRDPLNPWAIHHLELRFDSPPIQLPSRRVVSIVGVGWNEAPTPRGSVDLVPLTGAATQDVDGTWLVTLYGTLLQESQPDLYGLYYMISTNWRLEPGTLNGSGWLGNMHKPFIPQYPLAKDDSQETIVTRVACTGNGR